MRPDLSHGQALPNKPALKPYWGKPAVRNFRGDDGDVGIIRSPVRAMVLPGGRIATGPRLGGLGNKFSEIGKPPKVRQTTIFHRRACETGSFILTGEA